jgi:hypothetical protein
VRGQLAHQQEASPVAHFLESLRAAVATGKAHLRARGLSQPRCSRESGEPHL